MDFFNGMEKEVILAAAGVILSFFACFMGYRLQKAWIALGTFAAGFVLIRRIAGHFTSYEGAIAGCAIVFGLILAGLSYHIYTVGIFLAVIVASVWVSCRYIPNQWLGLAAGIAAGFFLGILAVRLNRPAVIVITAAIGAYGLVSFVLKLLNAIPAAQPAGAVSPFWQAAAEIVLCAAGICVQFRNTHPRGSLQ